MRSSHICSAPGPLVRQGSSAKTPAPSCAWGRGFYSCFSSSPSKAGWPPRSRATARAALVAPDRPELCQSRALREVDTGFDRLQGSTQTGINQRRRLDDHDADHLAGSKIGESPHHGPSTRHGPFTESFTVLLSGDRLIQSSRRSHPGCRAIGATRA
jgi:hypothetical protein